MTNEIQTYLNEFKNIYKHNRTMLGKIERIENYIKTITSKNSCETFNNLYEYTYKLEKIIDELEKYINGIERGFPYSEMIIKQDILDKIKELRGE